MTMLALGAIGTVSMSSKRSGPFEGSVNMVDGHETVGQKIDKAVSRAQIYEMQKEVEVLEAAGPMQEHALSKSRARLQSLHQQLQKAGAETGPVNANVFYSAPDSVNTCIQASCNSIVASVAMDWNDANSKKTLHCLADAGTDKDAAAKCFQSKGESKPLAQLELCSVCKKCTDGKPDPAECKKIPAGWADMRGAPAEYAGFTGMAAVDATAAGGMNWAGFVPPAGQASMKAQMKTEGQFNPSLGAGGTNAAEATWNPAGAQAQAQWNPAFKGNMAMDLGGNLKAGDITASGSLNGAAADGSTTGAATGALDWGSGNVGGTANGGVNWADYAKTGNGYAKTGNVAMATQGGATGQATGDVDWGYSSMAGTANGAAGGGGNWAGYVPPAGTAEEAKWNAAYGPNAGANGAVTPNTAMAMGGAAGGYGGDWGKYSKMGQGAAGGAAGGGAATGFDWSKYASMGGAAGGGAAGGFDWGKYAAMGGGAAGGAAGGAKGGAGGAGFDWQKFVPGAAKAQMKVEMGGKTPAH